MRLRRRDRFPTCIQRASLVVDFRLFLGCCTPPGPKCPVPSQRRRDQGRHGRAAPLEHPRGFRVHVVHALLSGSWASVLPAVVGFTYMQPRPHVHDWGWKSPAREVVEPRCYLEAQSWSPFRRFRLAQWSDLLNRFRGLTKRNTPPGPTSRSKSALIPTAPMATWVGIPRDIGCWEGWRDRDFLNLLKNDML